MKKLLIVLVCLFSSYVSMAQELIEGETVVQDSLKGVDFKYREDQFYFGITHTLMQDKPGGYSPSSVSVGMSGGFLRDFPINKSRNIAIAPGVGYSYVNLRGNLGVTPEHEHVILNSFKKSSISLHAIDFPIELRWRTSTPYSHKFWRMYVGFKASYVFSDRTKTTTSEYSTEYYNDKNQNKWLYGMYLSAGFNTWNFYMYYGLNNVYKNDIIKGDAYKLKMLNVGVMFYIL
ncbi:porin family protein [Myroides marinus]|uniref:Outer membrane protein beta-barrel domain-containing protein n=1 Tax=Myroides marinus TaxID=703342 RepID=A0A1H6TMX7_9FLAO|nr:porin family protein [Myroides marinus]MDM1378753.1 PorT family protein [Myroides marinus]MDM1386024.1 PorT family protein [Myroides marinus]MDM1393198.1 PorT family protein [Myroides marinus]SEI77102.1 Outer membrane protein beta-barrel domain-containing protein [Myroides marinus]